MIAAKGTHLGLCNRTACQVPGADYWNTSTRAWYCKACAMKINEYCPGAPLVLAPYELPDNEILVADRNELLRAIHAYRHCITALDTMPIVPMAREAELYAEWCATNGAPPVLPLTHKDTISQS